MWFHKKKAVNEEFETWRRRALETIDGCLDFWRTHDVFWEEDREEAQKTAQCLEETRALLEGISFRDGAAGFCGAADKRLSAIVRNRAQAESHAILFEDARALLTLAREWITR